MPPFLTARSIPSPRSYERCSEGLPNTARAQITLVIYYVEALRRKARERPTACSHLGGQDGRGSILSWSRDWRRRAKPRPATVQTARPGRNWRAMWSRVAKARCHRSARASALPYWPWPLFVGFGRQWCARSQSRGRGCQTRSGPRPNSLRATHGARARAHAGPSAR